MTTQEDGVPGCSSLQWLLGQGWGEVGWGGGDDVRGEGSLLWVDWISVRFRGKRTMICRLSLASQMDSRHNPARKIGFVYLPPRSL